MARLLPALPVACPAAGMATAFAPRSLGSSPSTTLLGYFCSFALAEDFGVEAVARGVVRGPAGDREGVAVGFQEEGAVVVGAVDVGAGGGEAGQDAGVGVAIGVAGADGDERD